MLLLLKVLDMRHIESQVLQEETASEQGSVLAGHGEGGRRALAPPNAGAASGEMYSFNLSFEELSTAGLEEPRHGNVVWMVSFFLTSCQNDEPVWE